MTQAAPPHEVRFTMAQLSYLGCLLLPVISFRTGCFLPLVIPFRAAAPLMPASILFLPSAISVLAVLTVRAILAVLAGTFLSAASLASPVSFLALWTFLPAASLAVDVPILMVRAVDAALATVPAAIISGAFLFPVSAFVRGIIPISASLGPSGIFFRGVSVGTLGRIPSFPIFLIFG